eukprot:CAMPEP_0183723944 /NCGR_PEP_ID=MMETSP0737-20130205/16812_1 /TAXON_ID=385413 /ORGANISM="Thalassiosira miniscula, Strain CCMP1093" /LENGTH=204 /DNA_ID=CAMNT_0025954375 /DNA_START=158 /DNA_END=772 /DNA_ORIENTATION=+
MQQIPNQRLRPRVRFSEASEMVIVTDLSEGPFRNKLWYTKDDLDGFKADMSRYATIVRLHLSEGHAPTASEILGMEKYLTAQLTGEYRIRRETLTEEVIKASRCQQAAARRGSSISNDKLATMLARISAEHSKWARERARAAALFLEQDQNTERSQYFQQNPAPAPVLRQWKRYASPYDSKQSCLPFVGTYPHPSPRIMTNGCL